MLQALHRPNKTCTGIPYQSLHAVPPSALQVAACEAVLNDALTPDVIDGIRQLYNQEPTFELVQLNCALAVLRMEQSRCDRDNSLLNVAQEHVERAKSISKAEMLPYMVQGTLELLRVGGALTGWPL